MKYAIGIDVGCSSIKGLALTTDGKVLSSVSLPTEGKKVARLAKESHQRRRGAPEWSHNVRLVFDQLKEGLGKKPSWIGIAAPGLARQDQRAIACMPGRLPGLEGLIWEDFLTANHSVPVLNDAQAALLGEVWCGAARNARNVILLTLGTGVGGAAMVDGHLLRGHIGRAGHLGHISLDPQGRLDVANTPGSLEHAIGDYTVRERSGGRFSSTRALVQASRRGDARARRLWLDCVRSLAAGIASLINVLDPELVVLGGGTARAGWALFRPLAKFLDRFEWRPGGARVRLTRARLGERAGAFGAAWNALHFSANSVRD